VVAASPPRTPPTLSNRRTGPGEFTVGALAMGAIVVLAYGNVVASGEPALALLGTFATSVVVLGTIGAFVALRRVTVTIDAPTDACVGDQVPLSIAVGRLPGRFGLAAPCEVRVLDPAAEWHATQVGERGTLRWAATRRGVVHGLRVEVRSSWPFGMFQRRRVVAIALDDPLHLAPRPVAADGATSRSDDDAGSAPDLRIGGDAVRSVRPYQAGDPQRLVHWASTARAGELMIRELEPPAGVGRRVWLAIDRDPAIGEPAAARAHGVGLAALRAGHPLLLATRERYGDVVARVVTERELGRRLARAVTGDPAPLDGPDVVVIR
jgi:uncharacterized protein (DUF58 family)